MIDPFVAVEVHLFFMLQRTTSVAAVDLCWYDEQLAEQVLARARMYQHAPGCWACTPETATWAEAMFRMLAMPDRSFRPDPEPAHTLPAIERRRLA